MPVSTLTVHGDAGPITGSIRHEGDILIHGSVLPGCRVEASGSLHVDRDIRSAEALSGGDLTIRGLVVGPETVVDAVGSISLRQAADARIVAGLDIEILTLAERCEIVAGRRIHAAGSPGHIVGGLCRPGRLLTVRRLLASGGRPAVVRVGFPPFAETREELERRLAFTRGRFAALLHARAASAREARRQAAESAAFRSLLGTLARRLSQAIRAAGDGGRPGVRILSPGPVEARIWLDGEEWRNEAIRMEEENRVDR
ncbi:MAG: FapA family protein [Planctomycetes bacterium]|jgi:hypothetical protein|nr:FapA family protein [Planctomycetota bacterium]